MKFYELFWKYTNEQIIDSLNKNYDDIDDESYLSALDELRTLNPSKEVQTTKINVEFLKDDLDDEDDKLYLSCDGIGLDEKGEMVHWALEFDDWDEWLAEEIDDKCLKELDELTILAGILDELTYNGYTESQIKGRKDELLGRCSESIERFAENYDIPKDIIKYDTTKNIKHLIERYNNKLKTLNVSLESYDEGLYDAYISCINDLTDILDEMEV